MQRQDQLTYEDILQMMQAYFDVLMRHNLYIKKIKEKKLSEDEIKAYFKEIFSIEIDNIEKDQDVINMAVIMIKQVLEAKYKAYLNCIRIAKHPNRQAAMMALYVLMDDIRRLAEYEYKMSRGFSAVGVKLTRSMTTEISRPEYLKSIYEHLGRLLSKNQRDELSSIVSIEAYRKVIMGIESQETRFVYHWDDKSRELGNITHLFSVLVKKRSDDFKAAEEIDGWHELLNRACIESEIGRNAITEPMVSQANKLVISVLEKIGQRAAEYAEFSKRMAAIPDDQKVALMMQDELFTNIEFYLTIADQIAELKKFSHAFAKQSTLSEELAKEVLRCKKLFNADKVKVAEELESLKKMISDLQHEIHAMNQELQSGSPLKEACKELLAQAEALTVKLENYKIQSQVFHEKYHVNYNAEYIATVMSSLSQTRQEIMQDRTNCMIRLNGIRGEHDIEKAASEAQKAALKAEAEARRKQLELEKEAALKAWQAEEKRKLAEYRREVEKTRQEKAVKAVVHVEPVAEVVEEPVREVTVQFSEKLLNMSNDNFLLLQDLFVGKGVVRYTDVFNLIVQGLGGEVNEVGNGSSHKSIRVDKFYANIKYSEEEAEPEPKVEKKKAKGKKKGKPDSKKSNAKEEKPAVEEASVAKGGMFKPHGKSKGMMGPFNMGLVVDTLVKAGITQALLDEFEEKRRLKKAESNYISSSYLPPK